MNMRMALFIVKLLLAIYFLPTTDAFLSVDVASSWKATRHALLLLSSDQSSVPDKHLPTRLHQQRSRTTTEKATTKGGQQPRRTWEESFELLLKFKEENGHCNVPQNYKQDPRLGLFVTNQRRPSYQCSLREDRRAKLESIGFSWDRSEDSWQENYQKLIQYREIYGDCNVPSTRTNDKALASWVALQRHRKEYLSKERISKLDEIDFSWQVNRRWDELYQELVAYRDENGDCNIPRYYPPNLALARWVSIQRDRKFVLSGEQRSKLDAIGFTWENSFKEMQNKRWHEMLDKLKVYREKHGDCLVPRNWSKDPSLGGWIATQRKQYSRGLLADDQVEELNKIDFAWRLRSSSVANTRNDERQQKKWLDKYSALEDFGEEHGHTNVPISYNATLHNWVKRQRKLYREERLGEDRKNLLQGIGFEWSVREQQQDERWLRKFSEYKALVDSRDRSLVTPAVYGWVKRQRIMHANRKLKPERKARLDDIGFEFAIGKPTVPR